MERNTTCCHDLCTLLLKVQGNVRPPRVSLGFKGWYAWRSLDGAQKRLRNRQTRKSLPYHLGAMRFKMQIPTLGSHSASLATGAMQSFSKGAGSSSGGTGIHFHSAAAAQSVTNKLCMQSGPFQRSLPGQSLAFHSHLMATFLTFHLLQALSLGRCLFPSGAGGQGAHSRGEGTQTTLPRGVRGLRSCPRLSRGCPALKALWTRFSWTAALSSLTTARVHQVTPTSCPCQRDSNARSTKGICQSLACKQFISIKQFLDLKVLGKVNKYKSHLINGNEKHWDIQ